MHGISGANLHCPAFVIEFDRDMSKEPNTYHILLYKFVSDIEIFKKLLNVSDYIPAV